MLGLDTHQKALARRHPDLAFGCESLQEGQVRAVLCERDPWFGVIGPTEGLKAVRRRWPAMPEPTLVLGALNPELLQQEQEADLLGVSGIAYLTYHTVDTKIKETLTQLQSAPWGKLNSVQVERNRLDFHNDLSCAKHLVDNKVRALQGRLRAISGAQQAKASKHVASFAQERHGSIGELIDQFAVLNVSVLKEAHLGIIAEKRLAADLDAMRACLRSADRSWRRVEGAARKGDSSSVVSSLLSQCLKALERFCEIIEKIRTAV